ncbi:MAG: hypothetical protein HY868_18535 [Chloroflexi bacterium]|nr:hypothetical protein [Chloroflexota bacterium]
MSKKKNAAKDQAWIDARKKYHLSDAHVQMARELGMNPKKLGALANTKQEPWKAPLPDFIERIYFKRFGKTRPDVIKHIEELIAKEPTKTPNPKTMADSDGE